MLRDFITSAVAIGAAIQATAGAVPPAQLPSNASPANQTAAEPRDPAAVTFTSEAGLVLHAVKPAGVADYEAVIVALQRALSQAEDEDTRRVAHAWRVYKAAEPDAKGSVVYVHLLQPVEAEVDYRPSLWLDKLLAGAPPELLAKYREAFAVSPTKLSLAEFADMAVTPSANTTPPRPTNGSPR